MHAIVIVKHACPRNKPPACWFGIIWQTSVAQLTLGWLRKTFLLKTLHPCSSSDSAIMGPFVRWKVHSLAPTMTYLHGGNIKMFITGPSSKICFTRRRNPSLGGAMTTIYFHVVILAAENDSTSL